jgi:hypothetical protein
MITSKRFQNHQNSLVKNRSNLTESLPILTKNWVLVNQTEDEKSLRLKSKN